MPDYAAYQWQNANGWHIAALWHFGAMAASGGKAGMNLISRW
jgi:hypothetical protein